MLQKLVTHLSSTLPGLIAVYRFGSWGTTLARPDSDIDLAILVEPPLDAIACWNLAQELANIAGRDVDLVELREASTVLRAQIIGHGERLYCSGELECERFEDLAYVQYARLNEERRQILKDVAERGRIHA